MCSKLLQHGNFHLACHVVHYYFSHMLEKVQNPCPKETESLRDSIKRLWNFWFRTVLGVTSRVEEIRGVCKPNHGLRKKLKWQLTCFFFQNDLDENSHRFSP